MAEAFAASISDKIQALFIRSVQAGKLWVKDIKQLNNAFNLAIVPKKVLSWIYI